MLHMYTCRPLKLAVLDAGSSRTIGFVTGSLIRSGGCLRGSHMAAYLESVSATWVSAVDSAVVVERPSESSPSLYGPRADLDS